VILIRRRLGQAVWVGDNNHFSHRLVRAGQAKPRAVLILLLIATTTGAVTFLK
jgi:UDP-N-acetylmuramyl pentapeptide phosphotransferase/UDP-N-acetylglucosamine-1-phosphate transferase